MFVSAITSSPRALRCLQVLCVLRDPKDVCISYYKFTQSLEMLTGIVSEGP